MSANNTVSHEIADVLRDEILRGQYRSGERLPSERDLASRFDASRGAVREALTQLEQLGIIRVLPGGARVQAIESASISILGPLMAKQDFPEAGLVDQFLQTFAALTSLTVRSAVEKADTAQLNQMRLMIVSLSEYQGDFESMQPKWREFLDYLAEVADNLVIRLIGNDLKAQFVEQMMKLGIKPEFEKKAISELFASLSQGIRERDADLAAQSIQLHFEELRLAVRDAIQLRSNSLQREAV